MPRYVDAYKVIENIKTYKVSDKPTTFEQGINFAIKVISRELAMNHLIPAEDVKPVKHGYWTGRLSIDDSCAEGFPLNITSEERAFLYERSKHITHCSVCGAMFNDEEIRDWKGCPYCLSVMDLKRPEDAYFRGWEQRNR